MGRDKHKHYYLLMITEMLSYYKKFKIKPLFYLIATALLLLSALPLFCKDGDVEIVTRPKLVYEAANLRDPFEDALPRTTKPKPTGSLTSSLAAGTQAAPLPDFDVQGLIWGGAMPQAVIDGGIVKVGDVIKDAEIVDISKEGVKVLFNKKIYKLPPPSLATNNSSTP